MFDFSIKKYSGLLIVLGSMFAGNVWAGCDIDYIKDTARDSTTRTLKVKYDLGSSVGNRDCQNSQWKAVYFTIQKGDGTFMRESWFKAEPKNNNKSFERAVAKNQTVIVRMYLAKGMGNKTGSKKIWTELENVGG